MFRALAPACAVGVCSVMAQVARGESAAATREKSEPLEAVVRRKRYEAEAATELESRRLRQVLREVEVEAAKEREVEVAAREELFRAKLAVEVEAKREALRVEREQTVQRAAAEAREAVEAAVEAFRLEIAERLPAEAAERLEAAAREADREEAAAEEAWLRERRAVESERAARLADLQTQVHNLLRRFEDKATEAAAQTATHRQTVLLARAALALSGSEPAKRAVDDLLATSTDEVVRLALGRIPADALARGLPRIDHLEDRFVARVEPALAQWLLLPRDLDNGLVAHVLAVLFAAAGFSTPPLVVDSKPDPAPVAAAGNAKTALVHRADLRECLRHLADLPTTNKDPNPAADWIADASARLLADQAVALLRAKIALLNAAHLPRAD